MYYFRIYGLKISTDLFFRQLVVDATMNEVTADVTIFSGKIPADIIEKSKEIAYEFGKNFSWLSNNTCFLVVENGNHITYQLKEGGNPEYLKTYILGWGMSMLGLQRGTLAIHCSAIANEQGALLICGESGAGKSTVTTEFLENGYRLMADDMAFVSTVPGERAMASPAFPYQKLCRDAAMAKGFPLEELIYIDEDKDKYLVPYKDSFPLEPVPVRGMIMLGVVGGEEVVAEEVTGLGKFQLVANNLFLRHLLGKKKYDPEIGQLCLTMAAAVPMAFIGRPQGKDSLQEVLSKARTFVEQW